MAVRFAARAVPGGAEAGVGAEARFRGFVEATLADGEITSDEERILLEKADGLGTKRPEPTIIATRSRTKRAGGAICEPPPEPHGRGSSGLKIGPSATSIYVRIQMHTHG